MSVYDDIYNLKNSTSILRNRTTVAVAKAAMDILNEDAATDNHANRVVWAQEALQNAEGKAQEMMWALLGNATVRNAFLTMDDGFSSEDTVVQNAVNAVIDQFATG